jgi:2-phospho-L-lactate/phosphoenolpyruvate guanylyltransferase
VSAPVPNSSPGTPKPLIATGPEPGPTSTGAGRTAVLVPVKSFDEAKGRLANRLDPEHRARLAQDLAARVLAAAGSLPRFVVCDSAEVARWALSEKANVIWHPVPGLNPAVAFAVEMLGVLGTDRVIVAHGDLPLAQDIAWVGSFDGVTIVPDRRGDGTNVMSVPTRARRRR